MSCHGGRSGDKDWKKHSDLGRFLAMHPVDYVKIEDCTGAFSAITTFSAEARYGMCLDDSDAYCRTPEEAIKRAVLRVRAKAGHPEEYQEDEEYKKLGLGIKEKPECLVCAKTRKSVAA